MEEAHSDLDFSEVIGQEHGKRALMIAAAGDHGILMMGGPGCGKTMMARRIPSILPRLSYEEQLELTGIYSVAGMLPEDEPVISSRPFRSPHHSISMAGLIGGGQKPRPGELSLAHRGVLFLDELGEFEGRAIDAMRQPVEDGFIRLNRNLEEIVFPSEVMIVAAANPCKCGNLWDEKKTCTCSSAQISSHMRKLTGPFADRIDMHVRVAQVAGKDLKEREQKNKGMTSAQMREKVVEARRIQEERYRGMPHRENGWLEESEITRYCLPDQGGQELLRQAYEKMGLTMRAYWKICKIARTIADLEGKEAIGMPEVAEALQFRIMEKREKKWSINRLKKGPEDDIRSACLSRTSERDQRLSEGALLHWRSETFRGKMCFHRGITKNEPVWTEHCLFFWEGPGTERHHRSQRHGCRNRYMRS